MTPKNKGTIAVTIGYTVFGLSFLFSKIAMEDAGPIVMIAVRFFVSFLTLNIIAFAGSKLKLLEFDLRGKPIKNLIILAIFQPVIYFFCESYGIIYTSSSFAGTIIAAVPIGGIVADVFFLHNKVKAKQIICAIVSVAGVALTTAFADSDMKSPVIGIIFLTLCVCSCTGFYTFSKKSSADFNALEQTYVMFGIGFAVYAGLALIQCAGNYSELIIHPLCQPGFIGAILYLGIVSSVVGYVCINYGTARISVSEASLFANITTVISIVAGVVILGEGFGILQIIGAAMILIIVYVASK